jgi:hypothetical protein
MLRAERFKQAWRMAVQPCEITGLGRRVRFLFFLRSKGSFAQAENREFAGHLILQL